MRKIMAGRKFLGPTNLTIAYIRDELRNNRYTGNTFDALVFMLQQYDEVYAKYKRIMNPQEYSVTPLIEYD